MKKILLIVMLAAIVIFQVSCSEHQFGDAFSKDGYIIVAQLDPKIKTLLKGWERRGLGSLNVGNTDALITVNTAKNEIRVNLINGFHSAEGKQVLGFTIDYSAEPNVIYETLMKYLENQRDEHGPRQPPSQYWDPWPKEPGEA